MFTHTVEFEGTEYNRTSSYEYLWAAYNPYTRAGRRSYPVSFHATYAAAAVAAGSMGQTAAILPRQAR